MHLDHVDDYLRGIPFSFASIASAIIEERLALARPDDGLHPRLVLWAAAANGGDESDALPVAVAFDLFDRFMRLHRELARESVQITRWGLGQSLNAGDALCAVAFRTLASDVGNAARRLAAAKIVGEAVLQAIERSGAASEFTALTAAAMRGGAIIGGAASNVAQIFAQAGRSLGAAASLPGTAEATRLLSHALTAVRSVTSEQFAQTFEEIAFNVAGRAA